MGGACCTHGSKKKYTLGLVGYLEDMRAIGRDGSSFEDNIKLDIK